MNKWIKKILYFIAGLFIGMGITSLILILTGVIYWHINYEETSIKQMDSEIVNYVYESCIHSENMNYISCINDRFKNKFEYKITVKIGLKEKDKKYIGECSDASLFYSSLLKKKDIKHYFVKTEGHIFVVAELDNQYCILDQKTLKCW